MLTNIELSWATGLFEGEGTVRINKPTLRNWGALCVSVCNTDKDIPNWFQKRWPGYMKRATGLRSNQKPAWVWVISSKKAIRFLKQIRPFVVRRKVVKKIDHAIYFQNQKMANVRSLSKKELELYRRTQWKAYRRMCKLNTRGVLQK